MLTKIFLFFTFLCIVFLPIFPVLAADNTLPPEKNPLCWAKSECVQARKQFVPEGIASEGWIQEGECIGDWGKCLSGGTTKTQISFNGQKVFSDAGVFIKKIYNYAVLVIGVIATVVIIISGLQWSASAGNSDTISSAKNRIAGALIGSFIAFMSYVILSAVNPATVNLRLPQVWLTRSIPLPLKWCQDYKDKDLESSVFLSVDDAYLDAVASQVKAYDIKQFKGGKAIKADTRCSVQYLLPGGADTCLGNKCTGVSVMSPKDVTQKLVCGTSVPCACYTAGTSVPYCVPAFFGGQIKLADIDHYVDDVTMWAVCSFINKPGVIERLGRVAASDVGQILVSNYGISFFESDVQTAGSRICGNGYDLEGFVLTAEINDNSSIASIDDTWLIGKNSCGNGGKPFAGFNFSGETSLLWEDDPKNLQIVADLANSGGLWLSEDTEGGVTCDLDIRIETYPNLSEDLYKS